MPEARYQLNLKPEHYIIYIQIKEDKDKTYEYVGDPVSESLDAGNRYVQCHNWCPSKQIALQCEHLHLDDELLINKPGFVERYDGGLRPFRLKTWASFFLKHKKKKNRDKTDEELAQS